MEDQNQVQTPAADAAPAGGPTPAVDPAAPAAPAADPAPAAAASSDNDGVADTNEGDADSDDDDEDLTDIQKCEQTAQALIEDGWTLTPELWHTGEGHGTTFEKITDGVRAYKRVDTHGVATDYTGSN